MLWTQFLIKSFDFKFADQNKFQVQDHFGRSSSTKGQIFNITRVQIRNKCSTVALTDRPGHTWHIKKLRLTREEGNKGPNLHSRSGACGDKSCKHFPLPGQNSRVRPWESGVKAFQIKHRTPIHFEFQDEQQIF